MSRLPICPACSLEAEGLGQLGSFALGVSVCSRPHNYNRARVLDAACTKHRPEMVIALGRATVAIQGHPQAAELHA